MKGVNCKKLINTTEAAEYLSVKPSWIFRRIAKGSKYFDATFPKPIKTQRDNKFLLSELNDWIDSQRNVEKNDA